MLAVDTVPARPTISANVMITGVSDLASFPVIAPTEFVPTKLLGLILQVLLVFSTHMPNALEEEFATERLANAAALMDTPERPARELPAPTIAQATELANTSKTFTSNRSMLITVPSDSLSTPRSSSTMTGIAERREDVCAMLHTEMLIARRDCARGALILLMSERI